MDLGYIQINAPMLALGYDNAQLVAFLLKSIPAEKHSARMKYWLHELEAGLVAGQHQWNNLAQVLLGYAHLYGFHADQPVAYCVSMAQTSKPTVTITTDPFARWKAQRGD